MTARFLSICLLTGVSIGANKANTTVVSRSLLLGQELAMKSAHRLCQHFQTTLPGAARLPAHPDNHTTRPRTHTLQVRTTRVHLSICNLWYAMKVLHKMRGD